MSPKELIAELLKLADQDTKLDILIDGGVFEGEIIGVVEDNEGNYVELQTCSINRVTARRSST